MLCPLRAIGHIEIAHNEKCHLSNSIKGEQARCSRLEPDVQGFGLGVAASILQATTKASEYFLMRSVPSGVKGDWVPAKSRC